MALNSAPLGEKSSIKGYSFHRWRGWWSKYRPTFLEKRGRHKPWSHHTSPNSSPPQSGSKWHIPTNKGYSVRPHREFENPINTKISTTLENTPSPRMVGDSGCVYLENKKKPNRTRRMQRRPVLQVWKNPRCPLEGDGWSQTALPDNSAQVSPPLAGISLPCICCFRQAAQPIALKVALSTALPATSLHLAREVMILMLLVDHSQNCSQLKGHLITSLVLWADICSPVLWEGGGQLQGWALACRCCPGTCQRPFSCPTLLRPGGLATRRGFSFGSPLWEGIPLCWQHSVAPCSWSC